MDDDLQLLREAGVESVVLPSDEDMYADGYRYRVSETDLSTVLEGVYRPGHFDGVLTVVLKLLQLAAADRAYFGEKDWQQLQPRPRNGGGVLPADRHRGVRDRA